MPDPIITDPNANVNQDPTNLPGEPASDPAAQAPPETVVTMSKEEYAELLTNQALLQQQLEVLAQQQRPAPNDPNAQAAKPLDQMNGAELTAYLTANSLQPIEQTVMQLAVQQELFMMQSKYGDDFAKAKDEVYRVCKANPNLSLEHGYLIVKGAEASKPKGSQTTQTTKTTPAAPPPPAEKPGIPASLPQQGTQTTVREATLKALKELNFEHKE